MWRKQKHHIHSHLSENVLNIFKYLYKYNRNICGLFSCLHKETDTLKYLEKVPQGLCQAVNLIHSLAVPLTVFEWNECNVHAAVINMQSAVGACASLCLFHGRTRQLSSRCYISRLSAKQTGQSTAAASEERLIELSR